MEETRDLLPFRDERAHVTKVNLDSSLRFPALLLERRWMPIKSEVAVAIAARGNALRKLDTSIT